MISGLNLRHWFLSSFDWYKSLLLNVNLYFELHKTVHIKGLIKKRNYILKSYFSLFILKIDFLMERDDAGSSSSLAILKFLANSSLPDFWIAAGISFCCAIITNRTPSSGHQKEISWGWAERGSNGSRTQVGGGSRTGVWGSFLKKVRVVTFKFQKWK